MARLLAVQLAVLAAVSAATLPVIAATTLDGVRCEVITDDGRRLTSCDALKGAARAVVVVVGIAGRARESLERLATEDLGNPRTQVHCVIRAQVDAATLEAARRLACAFDGRLSADEAHVEPLLAAQHVETAERCRAGGRSAARALQGQPGGPVSSTTVALAVLLSLTVVALAVFVCRSENLGCARRRKDNASDSSSDSGRDYGSESDSDPGGLWHDPRGPGREVQVEMLSTSVGGLQGAGPSSAVRGFAEPGISAASEAARGARKVRALPPSGTKLSPMLLQSAMLDQGRTRVVLAAGGGEVTSFGIDVKKLKFGAVIGRGANGRVMRGTYLNADVAIKEIEAVGQDDAMQQQFFTELEALRRLRHPHIVELYGAAVVDAGNAGSRYLFVTELAPCSLRDLLASEEPLTLSQSLRLATEIGKGCAFIHAMKVVHHDIKPANLLLSDAAKIKICDLGVARLESQAGGVYGGAGLAASGTAVHGSPAYMAPEMLRGEASVLSYGVDVYSWAIVFWEMLHRRSPHPSSWTFAVLFTKLLEGHRPAIGPLTPARLRRLIMACWAQDPDDRPEFEQVLVELSWAEQEMRKPERAFLPTHEVEVWKGERFVPGRISRNVGDGSYEVVLSEPAGTVKSFHASEILLVDGGGGLIGAQDPLIDPDVPNPVSMGSDDASCSSSTFVFRVVNDETPRGRGSERPPRPSSARSSTGLRSRSASQLAGSPMAPPRGLRVARGVTTPGSHSSSHSSDNSSVGDLVSSNDEAGASVDIDGIRIGVHGILNLDTSPSVASDTTFRSTGTRSRLSFQDDLVVLNEVGRGASGRVNRALELLSFQLVAIKSIGVSDPSRKNQIGEEIRALDRGVKASQNSHDGEALIQMYGAFFDPDECSVKIVMEYMDGGSCHDMLQRWSKPEEGLLVAIAKGALRSLVELHAGRRMHRDIKPANILLDRRAGAKLSDLGLARSMMARGAKGHENDAMAETFVGTIAYMSPERLEGKSYSYPADIWALGVTLVGLAEGRSLFREKSFFQLLEYLKSNPVPSVSSTYSPEMHSFLRQCTQMDPAKRGTAADLLEHPWIVAHCRADRPAPDKILRDYIEDAAEGLRYKRDELNNIAARVNAHLAGLVRSGSNRTPARVVVPLSKVRRLSQQLGVPVRHTIKAFKNNAA